MEKRSNKGLIITIVILALLLAGVSGYLVYDKVFSKEEVKETESTQEKEENKENSSDVVITQAEIDSMMGFVDFNPDEVTNVEEFNALDNQVKLSMGYSLVVQTKQGNEVKGSEIVEALKNIYGDKVTISLEDITCEICGEKWLIYNKDTDLYTYNKKHPGHGGKGGDYVKSVNYFDSIQVDDNQYKVIVKKVFKSGYECDLGPCDGNFKVYKSLDDAKNNKNLVLDTKEKANHKKYCVDDEKLQGLTIECSIYEIYQDYKEKFSSYTYTFIKNGDNYIFQSYELNK